LLANSPIFFTTLSIAVGAANCPHYSWCKILQNSFAQGELLFSGLLLSNKNKTLEAASSVAGKGA